MLLLTVCARPVAGPLGARNWEGFSPDPYLAGVAMNETIRGTQDAGAQACAKHFVGNEQETQRSNTVLPDGTPAEATSSNIDDRTMHELYLWPFTEAVKAGVASVMCSYNRLNQPYACENPKLLNGLLKGELGFQDYVVSEWMATHSGITAAIAGLDMNMPGPIAPETDPFSTYFGANITAAAQNGSLPASRLDDMVARILSPYFLLHQKPGTYPSVDPTTYSVLEATYGLLQNTLGIPPARDVRRNHTQLIRAIAAAGTVLLKNVNGSLPLALPLNIGVFGNDAAPVSSGLAFRGTSGAGERSFGFDVGTLTIGGRLGRRPRRRDRLAARSYPAPRGRVRSKGPVRHRQRAARRGRLRVRLPRAGRVRGGREGLGRGERGPRVALARLGGRCRRRAGGAALQPDRRRDDAAAVGGERECDRSAGRALPWRAVWECNRGCAVWRRGAVWEAAVYRAERGSRIMGFRS